MINYLTHSKHLNYLKKLNILTQRYWKLCLGRDCGLNQQVNYKMTMVDSLKKY
jgi:hypothetical protein